MKRSFALLFIFFIFAVAAACGRATPAPPPASEIIDSATARMQSLTGFHFVIERSGAPAYVDPDETLSFRRAEGSFVSPDQAQAQVRVIAPGLIAEVKMVSIGSRYWENSVFSGGWQELDIGTGFNPAILFDPQIGIQSILKTDLTNVQLIGTNELQEMPGKRLYNLSGDLAGQRLHEMSYGMIGPDPTSIFLWIAPDTFDLYRIIITEPGKDETEATIWQVDFWDFDRPVEIQPPIP
jgi:lipoprotein LprG